MNISTQMPHVISLEVNISALIDSKWLPFFLMFLWPRSQSENWCCLALEAALALPTQGGSHNIRGLGRLTQGRTGFLEDLHLVAANPSIPLWVFPSALERENKAKVIQIHCTEGGKMSISCVGAADDLCIISQRCLFVSWNVDSSFPYEFSQKLLFKKVSSHVIDLCGYDKLQERTKTFFSSY